jgi:hypothetical protein
MAFEWIKRLFRAPDESTMSKEERSFADESVEDHASEGFAAEHLGGIDPEPLEPEDD